MAKLASSTYNNANSGALYGNGSPLTGAILTGVWENAAHAKFGLGISEDIDGERNIAVLNAQGGIVSKGTVAKVASSTGKSPAYRGKLGKLAIVLWNMGTYYQVRLDAGVPQKQVSVEAASFLGVPKKAPVIDPETAGPQFSAQEMHRQSRSGPVTECQMGAVHAGEEPVDLEDIPF
jgi:hypothetical protein